MTSQGCIAVMTRIPREYYEDEGYYPACLHEIYAYELARVGAIRLEGPIRIKEIEFGYWDIDANQFIVVQKSSKWWELALVRILGPAKEPQ